MHRKNFVNKITTSVALFFLFSITFFVFTFKIKVEAQLTTYSQESLPSNNTVTQTITENREVLVEPATNIVPPKNNQLSQVSKPSRLLIPIIDVNAPVEHIGLTDQGAVGVPDDGKNVSWFSDGPKPGEKGNALISGHYGIWNDSTDSVFNYLHTLKPGDDIYIKDDQGKTILFKVQRTKVYGKDDIVPELFEESDDHYLNIITCHGDWLSDQKTYSQRFVVFAKMQP